MTVMTVVWVVLATLAASTVVLSITDSEAREVFASAVMALVLSPAVLVFMGLRWAMFRGAPSTRRVSPKTLSRFVNAANRRVSAYVFMYGSRGLLLIRKDGK